MAASVEAAAAAVVAPPASVGGDEVVVGGGGGGASEQARTLIGALNLLSRNLPLPPAVLHAVSSIYHGGDAWEGEGEEGGEEEVAAAAAAVGDGCGESGEGEEDRADASPGADEVRARPCASSILLCVPLSVGCASSCSISASCWIS